MEFHPMKGVLKTPGNLLTAESVPSFEHSLYLSLPHVPYFVYLGGPCPQVKLTFPAAQYFRSLLNLSPNYLAFRKVRKLRQNFKSQLGYQFSSLHWPFRDHSF